MRKQQLKICCCEHPARKAAEEKDREHQQLSLFWGYLYL